MESSFPPPCHPLSVWVLLLLLINSLIGLFVCSYPPQFILLKMRGKTPVPSANIGPFPLDLWGLNHFLPYPCSNQGVLFTYLSSHSPDLTENYVCKWQDFGSIRHLFLLLLFSCFNFPSPHFLPQDQVSSYYLSLGEATENIW